MCEGDDFWIRPQKLATQVEFLDANPSVAVTFHDCYVLQQIQNVVRLRRAVVGKLH